jgi:hypothetical protein
VASLNPSINVFVAKGSDLFKDHAKRVELWSSLNKNVFENSLE